MPPPTPVAAALPRDVGLEEAARELQRARELDPELADARRLLEEAHGVAELRPPEAER